MSACPAAPSSRTSLPVSDTSHTEFGCTTWMVMTGLLCSHSFMCVSQTGYVLVWRHQVVRKHIGNNVDILLLLYQLIFRVKSLNQLVRRYFRVDLIIIFVNMNLCLDPRPNSLRLSVSPLPRPRRAIPGDIQHGGHQVRGQPGAGHAARQPGRQRQPLLH